MSEKIYTSIDNPNDILKDITTCPTNDQSFFVEAFKEKLKKFSASFAEASKRIIELKKLTDRSGNGTDVNQEYYIFIFSYQFLNNLYSSVKLMSLGFHVASGNLLRQTVEGMALSWLLSLNFEIQHYRSNQNGSFNFFDSFKANERKAKSMYAIDLLQKNKDLIGIPPHGINALKNIRKIMNFYSHATKISSLHLVNTQEPDTYPIGGHFDSGNIKKYGIELQKRMELCNSLPKLINILISNMKNLNS